MDEIGDVEVIFRAAHECDTERVAAMLDDDPDLLSSTWYGQTLLIWPIWHGRERDVDVARLLLERGAEVDALGFMGRTALHNAAIAGRVEVLSLLLQSGADSSRTDDEGCTALMHAAEVKEAGIVRLLLENMGGRGLDVRDEEGRTALWLAGHFGNLEMVSALLLAGADHTVPDKSRRTPKGIAEVVEHEQCVSMIEVRPCIQSFTGIECSVPRSISMILRSTYSSQDCGCYQVLITSLCSGVQADLWVSLVQWWEGELQRPYLLHKARALHEAAATRQHTPNAPIPLYLRQRAGNDWGMPSVGVVGILGQSAAVGGKRGREGGEVEWSTAHFQRLKVGDEERHATVGYVVRDVNGHLYAELMDGLRQERESV